MSGDVISCYALGISRWELAHSVGFTESGVLPEQGGEPVGVVDAYLYLACFPCYTTSKSNSFAVCSRALKLLLR